MTTELTMLAWALVLAFVQIIAFDLVRTGQYGLKWNMSPRDGEMPELSAIGGRLQRAQNNLFETLPLFIAAVLIGYVSGRTDAMTALGAQIWLGARVVYLPLYAFGVTGLRSLAWIVSIVGLGMVVFPLLKP